MIIEIKDIPPGQMIEKICIDFVKGDVKTVTVPEVKRTVAIEPETPSDSKNRDPKDVPSEMLNAEY